MAGTGLSEQGLAGVHEHLLTPKSAPSNSNRPISSSSSGAHIESRASTEKDVAVQDIYIEKMIAYLKQIDAGDFDGMVLYPSTAVAFSVQDVFVQTPGPGAGERYDFTPGE